MVKKNNDFIKLLFVSTSFFVLIILAFSKIHPLFIRETLYLCQEAIKSTLLVIPKPVQAGVHIASMGVIGYISLVYIIMIFAHVRFKKSLLKTANIPFSIHRLRRKIGIACEIHIIESDKPFAFCFGLRRQSIYLSSMLLSLVNSNELEAILRHEHFHIINKDTRAVFISQFITPLFMVFPVLADLFKNFQTKQEIAADAFAITAMDSKRPLLDALKKIVDFDCNVRFAVVGLAQQSLDARIEHLIERKKPSYSVQKMNGLVTFVSIVILLSIIIMPVSAIEMGQEQNNMIMMCIDSKNCQTHCRELPMSSANNMSVFATYK